MCKNRPISRSIVLLDSAFKDATYEITDTEKQIVVQSLKRSPTE